MVLRPNPTRSSRQVIPPSYLLRISPSRIIRDSPMPLRPPTAARKNVKKNRTLRRVEIFQFYWTTTFPVQPALQTSAFTVGGIGLCDDFERGHLYANDCSQAIAAVER